MDNKQKLLSVLNALDKMTVQGVSNAQILAASAQILQEIINDLPSEKTEEPV